MKYCELNYRVKHVRFDERTCFTISRQNFRPRKRVMPVFKSANVNNSGKLVGRIDVWRQQNISFQRSLRARKVE